jgi:hypothetical protein
MPNGVTRLISSTQEPEHRNRQADEKMFLSVFDRAKDLLGG